MKHFDLIVIGSGPAGEKGAAQAAYFGKRVALIERAEHLGGSVINTGGVPSKTFRETVLYFTGLRQRGLYDFDYSLKENLTIESFMHRKQIIVESQWSIISNNLMRHNIQVIHGEARLKDKNSVIVSSAQGEEELSADVILIATGSSPLRPGNIPFEHELIYDSDEILQMKRIPRTMLVVGGGAIGTEYASIFSAMGVEVTLLEPRDRILAFLDTEIGERLTNHLEQLGLRFLLNDPMISIEPYDDHIQITLQSGAKHVFETALIAIGRQSNIENLGLEEVGVKVGDRGLVMVNEKYQTSVSNIYAAGDVIGFPALAATSMEQARVAMVHAFDLHYKETVSRILPIAVYAIPEISAVGLTENECKNKKIPYLVGRAYYKNSPRGQIIGDTNGMIKLIFSPDDKRLLGAHIIGEQASELIHTAAQVMLRGEPIDTFIEAVYNYPSLTDLYKYAAYDGLGKFAALPENESAGKKDN
jgi:NAD(P) transhydrogenase